jgi:Transposase DDE domain group 1
VSQAGGVALVETVRAAGLDRALSMALARWRKPTARHDPGKVITDLAIALALGATAWPMSLLRAEPGVFGPVASDPTVSRTIDTLAADLSRALKAIDIAWAAPRSQVWRLASEHAPDHDIGVDRPLIIDIDATLITAHSDKVPDLAGLPATVLLGRLHPARHLRREVGHDAEEGLDTGP